MYVRAEKHSKRVGRHRINDDRACLSTMRFFRDVRLDGTESGGLFTWRGLGEEKVGDKVFAGITIR